MVYENLFFIILGVATLVHIAFVTVTLGVGLITAIYRYLAYAKRDPELELFSRRAFRLLAVSELISGVWGTVITVVLAGFFPSLVALTTNILFTPIAIAVAGIMIRIPSIAAFWYTWGRINPRYHSVLGFVMAISGFLVPLGFRTIFAEITAPDAITEFINGGYPSAFQAYTNPLFWALYVHTVFAAISVGGFVVISVSAIDKDVKGAKIALPYAVGFLLLQPIVGFLYWFVLFRNASYIAERVTIGLTAPIFYLKLALVLVLIYLSLKLYESLNSNTLPETAKLLGPIALVVAVLGEFVNDASRHPYMVVQDSGGVEISSFFNYYLNVSQVALAIAVILLFLVVSLAIFTVSLYYALVRKFVT
ncbi:MAG: cytochrome ubiquinol oxidase subunit I [Acidilobaceae archaeon]